MSPCVLRFEASRHARIPSPSCWAFGLGFEAQTEKTSADGFVGKPPNHVRGRTTSTPSFKPQVFRFRRPDSLLNLALFLDLAATSAPAPCSQLRLALLAPCGPHLIPSSTGSLELGLLASPSPEASQAKTFRACSSPATTQTKPLPTPTILGQESVHTTLSITHH